MGVAMCYVPLRYTDLFLVYLVKGTHHNAFLFYFCSRLYTYIFFLFRFSIIFKSFHYTYNNSCHYKENRQPKYFIKFGNYKIITPYACVMNCIKRCKYCNSYRQSNNSHQHSKYHFFHNLYSPLNNFI